MNNNLTASKIMQCSTKCGLWEGDFSKALLSSSATRRCLEACMPAFFVKEGTVVGEELIEERLVEKVEKLPTFTLIVLSAIATGAVIMYILRRKR